MHNALGGLGQRIPTQLHGAASPSIADFSLTTGSSVVEANSSLSFDLSWRDRDDSQVSVAVYFDVDKNPFNGTGTPVVEPYAVQGSGPFASFKSLSGDFVVTAAASQSYAPLVVVESDGQTAYYYSDQRVEVIPEGDAATGDFQLDVVSAPPTEIEGTIEIRTEVSSNHAQASEGMYAIEYFLSRNSTLDADDYSLGPALTGRVATLNQDDIFDYSLSVPSTVERGLYYVIGRILPAAPQADSNANNNTRNTSAI